MIYNVTNDFTAVDVSTGTIQNNSPAHPVEISNQPTADTGILLYPLNKLTFISTKLYMRCVDGGACAEIRVVPFYATEAGAGSGGSGGGSSSTEDFATDDELQDLVDEVLNGDGGTDSGDVDPDIQELIDEVLNGDGGGTDSGDALT